MRGLITFIRFEKISKYYAPNLSLQTGLKEFCYQVNKQQGTYFKMSEMQQIVQNIQTKIKELEKTPNKQNKKPVVSEIEKLKQKMVDLIEKMPEGYYKERYYKQVRDVELRIKKHQGKASHASQPPVSGEYTVASQRRSVTKEEVLEKIVEKEITSKDLKVSPQELQGILTKMKQNLEVMQQIELIVKQTGDNIEKLDENIDKAYENVKDANKELNEANQLQISTRIMKIRLFASSIFGLIGSKLFGIFGLIGGLFAGFKTGSVLKQ